MNFVFSFPIAVLSQYFFGTIIFLLSLFMVLLILVQRGKGGGLTGALGGPGGQSAFGTKAGDLFTRITIVAAACWIFLLAFCVWWYTESDFSSALADSEVLGSAPAIGAPADGSMPGAATFDPGMSVPPTAPTDATSPVVPAVTAPAGETAKPNAEVEAGDLPVTTDKPAKASEKSESEATKAAEPAKEPDVPKSTEEPETEAAKSEPPAAKEQAPTEPTSTEPQPDSSKIPTPEK